MGAGQSNPLHAHPPSQALHILRVTPSSPASQTTIEPFFDFVVGFEGANVSSIIDATELERIVESHEGRTLNLFVWNSKNQETRVVPIIPSRAWSSPPQNIPNPKEPEPQSEPSLLGLSMRMCQPEFAMENVWHVLDVLEGSPAESAGLVPYGDWIIGWSGGALNVEGDFYDLVEAHIEKPLQVYVYSYDFECVIFSTLREVVLIPNRHWGGEGLLGCVFGFGLLHRIPSQPSDRQPGTIPSELEEPEDEYEEQELFVPADVAPESHYHQTVSPPVGEQWNGEYVESHHAHEKQNGMYPTADYGANNHEGHDHYLHDHHHNHGHNHHHNHHHNHNEHDQDDEDEDEAWLHNHEASGASTPRRGSTWATNPNMPAITVQMPTPTRSISLGTRMNGTTSTARAFYSVGVPSPGIAASPGHAIARAMGTADLRGASFGRSEGEEENDEFGDDETSVAGTDTTTTDLGSEHSLTSVD